MIGERQGCPDRLFHEFDLEDAVPADHWPRWIGALLDLGGRRRNPLMGPNNPANAPSPRGPSKGMRSTVLRPAIRPPGKFTDARRTERPVTRAAPRAIGA